MLQGVHAALVTPRRDSGSEIDVSAALELVDFACRSGLDGIVLLGTTGEFIHFDLAERIKLMRLAIKRSTLPVTVNISHSSLGGAVALAREAAASGAAALLLMPPYFFRYEQAEIEEFYLRFAAEAGVPLPVLLYNMPAVTTPLELDTLLRLLATGRFAGVKDSSGRMDEFRRMKAARAQTPFVILIGDDRIYTEARMEGADGLISGVASTLPELLVGLANAILSNATQKRDRLEARLHEFIAWSVRFPFPLALKEAASLRGLKMGAPACPLAPATVARLEQFREWFQGWLPVVLEEARG
ncbi:MAG: dihydrodipicolinate synthase family protein [Bryobacteraceae bacterium]|nr:dihydrodipicolinate synthase family protein [Bryobacteraceae bacterium]